MLSTIIKYTCFIILAIGYHQASAQTSTKAVQNPIILVMDASGSMWGQINTKTKIEIAREVIGEVVNDLDPKRPLGLVVYGHRQKGDCEDIEFLIQPGINNHEALIDALKALNPTGKTPLANAAIQVIETLKSNQQSATIILVSDGVESCGGDLCAVIKAAKEAGVDFVLHIVGFDIGDSEKLALECAASAGDGLYLDASDGSELSTALEQVVELPVEEVLATTLSVKGTKHGELHDIAIQIFKPRAATYFTSKRTYSHEHTNPAQFGIPPGTYDIKAVPISTDADEIWKKGIVVSGEAIQSVEIDFSPGTIAISTTANNEPWDCVVNVVRIDTNKKTTGGRTYKSGKLEKEISPGLYKVTLSAMKLEGMATTQTFEHVEIIGGQTNELNHNFEYGELSTVATNNGQYWDCLVSVLSDDGNKKKSVAGGRTYKSDDDNTIRHLLTPGTYDVKFRPHHIHGEDWEQTTTGVQLRAGEQIIVAHDYDTGLLHIGAQHNGAPTVFNITLYQNGKNVYSKRARVDPSTHLTNLNFTPGDYEVTVKAVKIDAAMQKFPVTIIKGGKVTKMLAF